MNVYKIEIEAIYSKGLDLEWNYDIAAKSGSVALKNAERLLRSERVNLCDKDGEEIPDKFYKLKSYDVVLLKKTATLDA